VINAHNHLIKYALDAGHRITVWNGGDEAEVELCSDFAEVLEHTEAADDANLMIYSQEGKFQGEAFVIHGWDMQLEEMVADYTVTPFMDAWNDEYSKLEGGA